VEDGVSGLHFRKGDPEQLAEVMRRAATTPGLWHKLRSGIPPVPKIEDHAAILTDVYRDLMNKPRRARVKGDGTVKINFNMAKQLESTGASVASREGRGDG
jgi:hypothetical protein